MELKGLIYDEVRLHEQNMEEMAGFTLTSPAAAGLSDAA
jgi:hypothetical protein